MTEQTTELAIRSPEQDAMVMGSMMKMAETLIASGFLPAAIKTPAQAVAVMMTGRELQIPTMQALRQINVIQGKPTMGAELMLALAFQRIPGFKCHPIESTDKRATFEFQRPGQPAYRHTFTLDDAAGMGLIGKDNWRKQAATMLRWRCISAGLRLICPDAIAGLYTPEEIEPTIAVDPTTGAATITANTPAPSAAATDTLNKKRAAVEVASTETSQQPDPARGEESQVPAGTSVVTGKVESVNEKKSPPDAEKPWVRYGIKLGGTWYSTFDSKFADLARNAKEDDQAVDLEYVKQGQFTNCVGIRLAGQEAPAAHAHEDNSDLFPNE